LNIILDACAVIAFFRDEAGADVVEQYLLSPDHFCLIHAVNLCEVYYDFLKSGGAQEADRMTQELIDADVGVRRDLDDMFWRSIANYKATIRRISLADCFALTLAKKLDGTVVTSDRKEFEPVALLNLCPIIFIR
jgi:PIN domain nuclease of toxin-antitoxin system